MFDKMVWVINTFKYNVFASMGIFKLELIYLYSPPSFHLTVGCFLSCRPFVVITTFSTRSTAQAKQQTKIKTKQKN